VAAIELHEVSKRYGDGTHAVKALDLDVADGELVIFVGPSGCGKTTALRMIAGLEEISDGRLRIGGEVVNDRAPKDRDIAMVFQNYALYPHMTVRRNMGFALRLQGLDKAEIDRRVESVSELLDLSPHLDRRPAKLSGGQRQRVAMGRAIVREPKAFLMDEPLSNLDAKLRVEMRVAISRLQRRLGTTTIYVTHDQTEAMTLGDRVAVMRDGVLQQFAAPEDLYARPANRFVAGFIGSPAMNFVEGDLTDGVVRTPLGDLPLGLRPIAPGRVTVGIRPEALSETPPSEATAAHAFDASVELAECVGADVYARLVRGDARVVARFTPAARARAGESRRVWLDTAAVHLFDATDGRAL
jgi:multiple sugar transport system ATP-binding protein